MAVSLIEEAKQEVNRSAGEESDGNEAEKSLNDFLRDTDELMSSATQDNPKTPDSSDDAEGEIFVAFMLRDTIIVLCALIK